MLKDLSRRDLNEFANSKKTNPLIFIAASVFAGEIPSFPMVAIMASLECKFEKISGIVTIFRSASSCSFEVVGKAVQVLNSNYGSKGH